MEKNLEVILAIDTIAVAIAMLLLFLASPFYQPIFQIMSVTMLVLGSIAVLATLIYYTMMGNVKREYLIGAFVIFVVGIGVTFVNWFAGGLIALAGLYLLLLSKENTWENLIPVSLIFVGFSLLAILPPLEALLGYSNPYLNYGIIGVATVMILLGTYLSSKKEVSLEVHVGYLMLSLIFLMLPAYHEILGIRSNGSYGVYDMAMIFLAVFSYIIFLANISVVLYRREKLQKEIEEGYKYLEEGDWLSAYSTLKKVYSVDPFNENALNGMAIALMRMGMFSESEDMMKKLLKIKRRDQYLVNLGNLFYRMGDVDGAIKVYQEVLNRNPKCYMAMNNLARCYIDKGDYEKAEELLKNAMAINPNSEVVKANYNLLTMQDKVEMDFEEEGLL